MPASRDKSEHTAADIREVLGHLRNVTREALREDRLYGIDRTCADEYLSQTPKWEKLIREFFQALHDQGEKVVYADICGRASALSMGVDRNYSFSLQRVDRWLRDKRVVRVQGDVFSAGDFYSFVNLLRRSGDRPALVTFVPIVGLGDYSPGVSEEFRRKVVYQRLRNNLGKILEVVRPGGFIFLDRPFQGMNIGDFFQGKPFEEYEASLWVKDFCKTHRCPLKMVRTCFGTYYLIRKRAEHLPGRP